jgi:hypothetical protein
VKRHPGWEYSLQAAFAQAREHTFAWGQFDCALFACDCVAVMTGEDPAAEIRGHYSNEQQAIELIGGDLGTFAATIAAKCGMPEVRASFAGRGDVVLVDNGEPGRALGVVDHGGRFAWCAAPRGLRRVGIDRWLRAWKV